MTESELEIYLGDKLSTIYDAAVHIYQLSPTTWKPQNED